MEDQFEAVGKLGTLYEAADQARQERVQWPEFRLPTNEPAEPEEDDSMTIPDVPGLTIAPLVPKRKREGADG